MLIWRYQVGADRFYIGTENSCAPTWHSAVATKSSPVAESFVGGNK